MWRHEADTVRLVIQRGVERLALTATVHRAAASSDPLALTDPPDKNLVARLGLFCVELAQPVLNAMPDLRKPYGLVVVARLAESQCASAGLRPGDVIHALNNLPIATLEMFRSRIDQMDKGAAVALQIEREGHLRYVAFPIE